MRYNEVALRQKMIALNIKTNDIARALNISHTSVYNKLHGRSEFTLSEVQTLKALLELSEEDTRNIFFAD